MTDDRARFLELVTGDDFDHSGGVVLEDDSWDEFALRLRLRVELGADAPAQFWFVHVKHSYRERLSREWTASVHLGREHPTLIPYTQPEADIFFTGNALSARELLGIVTVACGAELGGWHAASEFLNEELGLAAGWCGPYGLLGRFPVPVAARILQDLVDAPIRPVLLNQQAPSFWDGGWQKYSEDAEAFVFGSCFVVGEGVRVEAT